MKTPDSIPTIDTLTHTTGVAEMAPLVEHNQRLAEEAQRVFGESVVVVEQPTVEFDTLFALTDNAVVWSVGVALFVYFLFVMFAYGNHFGQMWKVAVGDNLGIRVADELSYLFMRAVHNSVLMGIVAWVLVAVGWLAMLGVEGIEGVGALWMVPAGIGVLLVVGAVQRLVTLGICHLVRRKEIAEGVNILADTLMALTAIVVTPISLLFVVNTGASAEALGWVALTIGAIALCGFVTKSLIFFLEQKVSILLWFLYLCAVVLIPIGIVATVVVRGSVI